MGVILTTYVRPGMTLQVLTMGQLTIEPHRYQHPMGHPDHHRVVEEFGIPGSRFGCRLQTWLAGQPGATPPRN